MARLWQEGFIGYNVKTGRDIRYGPLSYQPSASIGPEAVGCVCCIKGITPEHGLGEAMPFMGVCHVSFETDKSRDVLIDAKSIQKPAQTSRHATKAMEQQTPTGSSDILNRARLFGVVTARATHPSRLPWSQHNTCRKVDFGDMRFAVKQLSRAKLNCYYMRFHSRVTLEVLLEVLSTTKDEHSSEGLWVLAVGTRKQTLDGNKVRGCWNNRTDTHSHDSSSSRYCRWYQSPPKGVAYRSQEPCFVFALTGTKKCFQVTLRNGFPNAVVGWLQHLEDAQACAAAPSTRVTICFSWGSVIDEAMCGQINNELSGLDIASGSLHCGAHVRSKPVILLHLSRHPTALNTTMWATEIVRSWQEGFFGWNGKTSENVKYGRLSVGKHRPGCCRLRLLYQSLGDELCPSWSKPAQTSRHATKAMEQQTPTQSSDNSKGARCEPLQWGRGSTGKEEQEQEKETSGAAYRAGSPDVFGPNRVVT
ncbi:hypothetical protein EDB84DRAFT_1679239 [Lactarius hengduanensis]|nr:hypothetical protein EDB84DRAFT_1679239 [Lactarius hengduanensis]